MTFEEATELVRTVAHWHHTFEIFPGLKTPGAYEPQFLLDKMQLGGDLKGCRVLDIGPADGFFSREVHKRGAEVVCIDYRPKNQSGFAVMEKLYGVELDFRQLNIYDLPKANLGHFDLVFFLGILYYMPDMLRALINVRDLARGTLFLESHSENDFCNDVAAARYHVGVR